MKHSIRILLNYNNNVFRFSVTFHLISNLAWSCNLIIFTQPTTNNWLLNLQTHTHTSFNQLTSALNVNSLWSYQVSKLTGPLRSNILLLLVKCNASTYRWATHVFSGLMSKRTLHLLAFIALYTRTFYIGCTIDELASLGRNSAWMVLWTQNLCFSRKALWWCCVWALIRNSCCFRFRTVCVVSHSYLGWNTLQLHSDMGFIFKSKYLHVFSNQHLAARLGNYYYVKAGGLNIFN